MIQFIDIRHTVLASRRKPSTPQCDHGILNARYKALSQYPIRNSWKRRQKCIHGCGCKPMAFLLSPKKSFRRRHVPPAPSALILPSEVIRTPLINYISSHDHDTYTTTPSSPSSGHSSPQSSFSSVIFSSVGSNNSRSPATSHASFSDLTLPTASPFVRRQPRIQVSSLLADPHTRTYDLRVVQHPVRTAEFGLANLSRLPLTPPMIAQLIIRDPSGNSVVPEAELPFLIAHLSLYSGDGSRSLDMGSSIGRGHTPPILYGNLVSSVDQLEDLQGNMGLFFLFPDVSVRWRGQYQLGITLSRLSMADLTGNVNLAQHGTHLAEARTRTFDVLALDQYTAAPTTRLTQSFVRQGARMFTYVSYN